jgi:hypothetical protein
VEETSKGGLMFATEPVTASLASLLSEKDEQERSGGVGGRGSRFVVEEQEGQLVGRRGVLRSDIVGLGGIFEGGLLCLYFNVCRGGLAVVDCSAATCRPARR